MIEDTRLVSETIRSINSVDKALLLVEGILCVVVLIGSLPCIRCIDNICATRPLYACAIYTARCAEKTAYEADSYTLPFEVKTDDGMW